MEETIKLSEWAKRNGMAYRTAVTHYHNGWVEGAYQIRTGSIFVKIPVPPNPTVGVALYSRVSSSETKDNLERQKTRLEDYAAAKGYNIVHNISEIGSGLNDSRPKLLKLFTQNDWNILIIEHKDRLTRFGFNYINTLLEQQNKKIEVINTAPDKDDLIQDFVSIITSFSARIYGRRRSKRQTEKLIKELEKNGSENN